MPHNIDSVVDNRQRVYGSSNLRVYNASIIPLESTVNPQAVLYGIAEPGDSLIKEDLL